MSSDLPQASSPTVLIADDEPMVLEILQLILESLGLTIAGRAANGAEAVEMNRTLKPDLVLMDIGMPVLDGISATAQIRKESSTPVLICSGLTDPGHRAQATAAGACGFVPKPIRIHEIEAMVQQVLGSERR